MNQERIYLIRVKPGTRQSKVTPAEGDVAESFVVWTRAPAIDGRANLEVAHLLSKHFGVPKRNVEVLSGHTGHTGRIKRIKVRFA